MLEEGVTIVTYDNIVGIGKHIQTLDQVGDENLEHLVMYTNTTRLQATIYGRVVTYDF